MFSKNFKYSYQTKSEQILRLPSRHEFARFLVPWRQTKTHRQYFIGNLELKNHPNPHNLKWKTVSQFLIGKVLQKIDNVAALIDAWGSQFLIGKVLLMSISNKE